MKLSTKGQYGLRAMYDLALNYNNKPVSIKQISEHQNVSIYYLEQLISILRKNNLVKSIRGAQGGYILSRDPKEINVGEIINLLEGPIEISECLEDNNRIKCVNEELCPIKLVWVKIRNAINDVLNNITLDDLLKDYNILNKNYSKEMK